MADPQNAAGMSDEARPDADRGAIAIGCLGAQAQVFDRGIVAIVTQVRQVEKRQGKCRSLARALQFHGVLRCGLKCKF
ncbi:hypothetical protein D3C80_379780 [compost metagenome]